MSEELRKETVAATVTETYVETRVKREQGKLYLYVDASGLHRMLDRLGAHVEPGTDKYANRPATNALVARDNTVSTDLLLTKPADGVYPIKRDLSAVYVNPPAMASLRALVDSPQVQSRKILEHYHPVDIVARVHKKLPKRV